MSTSNAARIGGADDAGVDVGILDADADAPAGDTVIESNDNKSRTTTTSSSSSSSSSRKRRSAGAKQKEGGGGRGNNAPTCRWDVHNALKEVQYPGHFSAAGPTTANFALPPVPGLCVDGIGELPLPISDQHAKKLKKSAWEIEDESYRNVYQIEPESFQIRNPLWDAALEALLRTAAVKLGIDPSLVRAELDMLLLFEKGGFIEKCRNTGQAEDVLGTLMIQLPSHFTGGKMAAYHDSLGAKEESFKYDLGAGTGAAFSCHYFCHFADCDYEMKSIKSGHRMVLMYSLCYDREHPLPTARLLRSSMARLERSLELLPRADRLFLLPLEETYTSNSLARGGVDALDEKDRGNAQAFLAAGGMDGWKLLIVSATRIDTRTEGYYGNIIASSSKSKLNQVFGESGKVENTTKIWLDKVIDFDSCQGNGSGMMLAGPHANADADISVSDVWGRGKMSHHYGYGYDEDDYQKTTYRHSFLLAYDVGSEFEIKCLSGREGVSHAAWKVSTAKDYHLLARLVSVVETKTQCKLCNYSCLVLLQMVATGPIAALGRFSRISLVKKVLGGLTPELEPEQALYDLILVAVESIGWRELSETISQILGEGKRKRAMSLAQFVARVDFVMKLRESFDIAEAPSLLRNCFDGLSSSTQNHVTDTATITLSIESMVSRHGWKELEEVVSVSMASMHNSQNADYRAQCISDMISRTELLLKLYTSNRCEAIESHLSNVVKDFVAKLEEKISGRYRFDFLSHKGFTKLVRLLFRYGKQEAFDCFGLWATSDEKKFSKLINAILESTKEELEPISLARDLLNKCLIQYSTSEWSIEGGDRPPSLHIRIVLDSFHDIAQIQDKDGRLPIHHASACGGACLESIMDIFEAYPKGGTTMDPVTGLFPFMLASSNDNVDASYKLLLADPSLVAGVGFTPGEGKKRKRSMSSEGCCAS